MIYRYLFRATTISRYPSSSPFIDNHTTALLRVSKQHRAEATEAFAEHVTFRVTQFNQLRFLRDSGFNPMIRSVHIRLTGRYRRVGGTSIERVLLKMRSLEKVTVSVSTMVGTPVELHALKDGLRVATDSRASTTLDLGNFDPVHGASDVLGDLMWCQSLLGRQGPTKLRDSRPGLKVFVEVDWSTLRPPPGRSVHVRDQDMESWASILPAVCFCSSAIWCRLRWLMTVCRVGCTRP